MVKVKTARSKGANAEYDFHASLLQAFPNAYLTKQRGFQLQYDIQDDASNQVFEVKRLRGISWNQCVDFYEKLKAVAPKDYKCYVLFKSNFQPALVFGVDEVWSCYTIRTFFDAFGVPFKKHEPIKRIKLVGKKEGEDEQIISSDAVA